MTTDTVTMPQWVERYLEYRRALGSKLGTEGYLLRSFARYTQQHAPGKPLKVVLALQWATEPKMGSRLYHAKRLDALRPFARYLAAFEPQTQVPPTRILGPSFARTEPHLYTKEETLALMHAARAIRPPYRVARTNPLRNVTVIGLLACTGMRIGEVLALKNQDVDLAEGILTVRRSKNLPMRLVPIMDCTVRRLLTYQEARDRCFGPSGPSETFIRSAWGGRLTYVSFRAAFTKIRQRAGLQGRSATGREVRLHDFRHTFACTHLLRAYRESRNIDNAVHELSIYLGHATLACTYWYLTGVPVLLEQCTQRFEAQMRRRQKGGGI